MRTKTNKIITKISFCHQGEGTGGGPPPPLRGQLPYPPPGMLLLFGQAISDQLLYFPLPT